MTANRQPKGTATGGQFAAGSHSESEVTLEGVAPDEPELKLQELDWAESLHGSYDADSVPNYYPVMARVFAAARKHVENTPGGQDELAGRERAEKVSQAADKLADVTSIPAREIRDFHSEMAGIEPNSPEWEETLRRWSQDIWNQPRGTVSFVDYSMREAAAVEEPTPEMERQALIAERRRLDARIDDTGLSEPAPISAPLLHGFTAEQVEEEMLTDWHQDQCGCDLPAGSCLSYGDTWRGQGGVPNVHAVFETAAEMASQKEPK